MILLFATNRYYPNGGAEDFVCTIRDGVRIDEQIFKWLEKRGNVRGRFDVLVSTLDVDTKEIRVSQCIMWPAARMVDVNAVQYRHYEPVEGLEPTKGKVGMRASNKVAIGG